MNIQYYYFIDEFNKNEIEKLPTQISLIYRNYNKKLNISSIIQIKKYCKINKRKFFLSNNFKVALKLGLDGVYLPSFNKSLKHRIYRFRRNFQIIGSAHNIREIKEKQSQGVKVIFIGSLFKKKESL